MGLDSFFPGYPHRGLLGRSNRCDQAFQEVHGLGMASYKELVCDCIPKEASETGEPNGENWRAQWFNHRFLTLVDCSPAGNGKRRWGSQLKSQPTVWSVARAKSVLYFLLRILWPLHCFALFFFFGGISAQHKK